MHVSNKRFLVWALPISEERDYFLWINYGLDNCRKAIRNFVEASYKILRHIYAFVNHV